MDTYKWLKIGGIACSFGGAVCSIVGTLIGEKKAAMEMAAQVSKEVARQLGK